VGINKTAQNYFGESLSSYFLLLFWLLLFLFFHGQEDQSAVSELTNRSEIVQNGWVNLVLFLSDLIVYKGFGLASCLFDYFS
jgi:S-DNA-T family DNA segregation ATPase FtsK/SpoIIIE